MHQKEGLLGCFLEKLASEAQVPSFGVEDPDFVQAIKDKKTLYVIRKA